MNLSGKTAVVTGGSRGIGREICLQLAKAGAHVVFAYRSAGEAAESLLCELRALHVQALGIQCDVADFDAAGQLMKAADGFGGVDILINNAGITRDGLLMRMSEDSFDAVIDTNLKGTFNCMRHAAPLMVRKRAGRMINITSVAGLRGNAGQVNYAASKAGVVGMTLSAAKELGARGITVNAIAPGFIETDMTDSLGDRYREALLERISLKRLGQTADIAALTLFLASDDASYITGQVISVDGGLAL